MFAAFGLCDQNPPKPRFASMLGSSSASVVVGCAGFREVRQAAAASEDGVAPWSWRPLLGCPRAPFKGAIGPYKGHFGLYWSRDVG